MKPLISIVVPIYNAVAYLEQCISSIIEQSYQNLQIILVDDGSTDGSLRICNDLKGKDDRVEVYHKENGGVVSARKFGVAKATGMFVCWVDSDDWIEVNLIDLLVKKQLETQADIVAAAHYHDIGGKQQVVRNGISVGTYHRDELIGRMLYTGDFFEYGIGPHLCTKLIRKDILSKTQFDVDDRIIAGDDAAVVYPSILEANKVCITDICGYHYIQRNNSITKREYADESVRIKVLLDYLRGVFGEKNILNMMESQLNAYEKYMLALRKIDAFDEKSHRSKILVPFGGILPGSRIVIYGAGVLGQKIYNYLNESNKVDIIDWLDQNWQIYQQDGYHVCDPKRISDLHGKYDYVIIANTMKKTSMSIRTFLERTGVEPQRILWFSNDFIGKE